jgi:hypothetical protein
MNRSPSAWRELVFITIGYTFLTIGMTYPLVFQLNAGLASHTPDVWILAWDNWWIQQALAHGQNIFFTPLMFHPNGVSLAAHSFSFTHTLISSLFQIFTNPIAAFNLATFAIFPISGLGMYLLAKHLTSSRAAAWIAGLIYAFAPYHMTQALGHPHLAYVQFIPCAVLFTLKAIESFRGRYLVTAILFFTLTAYAGQHLLVVAFTWLVIFLPIELLVRGQRLRKQFVLSAAAIVLGTLVLSFPLYQPALSDVLHGQSIGELQTGEFDDAQTDALAYFIPTRYQPVFGSALEETYRNLSKNNLWMPYLGYIALILAAIGVIARRKNALPWIVSGLVCILLALGPQLRLNGTTYSNIVLPFTLLQNIFPFSFLRSPDRFNLVVSLPLAVSAAYGMAALSRKLVSTRRRIALITGLSLVILFEYLNSPYPIMPRPDTSPFIAQMASDPDPYAVIDLPMGRNPSKVYLYYQSLHHKPLVEGHVSRTPDHAYDFIDSNALLRRLRAPDTRPLAVDQRQTALQQLADQHVRYLLIHRSMSNPDQIEQYRSIIGRAPIYTDDVLEVYAIAP